MSTMGHRLGIFGPWSILFLAWVHERRQRQEPLVFHECTIGFKEEVLQEKLSDLYDIHTVAVGPEDFGWWVSRPHKLSILILRSAAVFIGDIEMFHRVFIKHRTADSDCGSMFVCAPPAAVSHALAQTAERCQHRDTLPQHAVTWRSTLPDGDRRRLQGYEAGERAVIEQAVAQMIAAESAQNGLDEGTHIVDETAVALVLMTRQLQGPGIVTVTQTYGERGCSNFQHCVPALLTCSRLYSLRQDRLLLGGEHLLIQGVPVWSSALNLPFQSAWCTQPFLESQLKFAAGNAIHGMCAGALTAFAFTCVVFREPQKAPAAVPSSPGTTEADDEDDE